MIPENTFANLSGLSSLLLDHNPLLRHVSPGAFNGLEQLYVLRLDHNDLRHLEANVSEPFVQSVIFHVSLTDIFIPILALYSTISCTYNILIIFI